MSSPKKAQAYALLAGITWGFSGTIAAYLPTEIGSLTIAAFRLFLGGLFLLAYQAKNVRHLMKAPRESLPTLFISALALVSTQACFFSAVSRIGVGLSTMIYIGSSPLFAGILERLTDKVPLSGKWFRSVLFTLVGSVILGAVNWDGLTAPSGLLYALGAGLSWSTTGLTMKRLQKYKGSLEVTTQVMVLSGLMILPLLSGANWPVILTAPAIPPLLLLGLLTASIPYALYNLAVKTIPAGHAIVLGMSEPLTAALLGILLLGEPATPLHLLGYALIFTGVLLLYLSPKADS
ncbi:MAG: EamA family transporter [Spirochaetales bacterium]|nr:EamA family transporter [Spirochaetales bacterium]